MNDVQAHINVLRPSAGDMIVLTVPGRLNDRQRDQVRQMAAEWMPVGVNVLVLDAGITMAHVIAPAPAVAAAAPAVSAPHPDFDTWMRHRVNVAHAKYMERTSYHLRSDWRVFSPEAIEKFINGAGV